MDKPVNNSTTFILLNFETMKPLLIALLALFTLPLMAQTDVNRAVGQKVKSFNDRVPYTYKNGYKMIALAKVDVGGNEEVHQLQFQATHSSSYTQKVMFDQFGMWDKAGKPSTQSSIVLIWRDVKLLEDSDMTFTVVTSGKETFQEIYSSVAVFTIDQEDALAADMGLRRPLLEFFANGIKDLSSNKTFYKEYKKLLARSR